MIRKAAIRKGGSGQSDMDDYGLHRIVASKYFGKSSSDLHMAFANVVQKLCIDLVETIDFSILPLNIVGQKPRTWNHWDW